ncbi:hypothetical protein RhiirA4_419260, partial [Rhizophagus irregularis]
SPEPPGGYKQRSRKPLEKMTKRQFKNFRDEIVQILSCLDPLLSLDHKKKWSEISDNVSKKIIPAINNALHITSRKYSDRPIISSKIQYIKVQRKRWYDNSTYKNDSKLPDNAPEWTVSFNYNVKKKIKGVVEQRRKAIKDEFDKESGEDVEDKEDEEDEENELNRRVEEKLGRRVEAKIRRRIKEEQS